MDKETALSRLENFDGIYGTMYGQTWLHFSEYNLRDEVVFIDKKCLKVWDNGFMYIWGGPGPDYNVYKWEDFGVTWGFTPHDIKDQDVPEGCVLCKRCMYVPMTFGNNSVSLPEKCPLSKEILSGRQVLADDFDGCCNKGRESENAGRSWPLYFPTKEDLYDIKFVPATSVGPNYFHIKTWREQEERANG